MQCIKTKIRKRMYYHYQHILMYAMHKNENNQLHICKKTKNDTMDNSNTHIQVTKCKYKDVLMN